MPCVCYKAIKLWYFAMKKLINLQFNVSNNGSKIIIQNVINPTYAQLMSNQYLYISINNLRKSQNNVRRRCWSRPINFGFFFFEYSQILIKHYYNNILCYFFLIIIIFFFCLLVNINIIIKKPHYRFIQWIFLYSLGLNFQLYFIQYLYINIFYCFLLLLQLLLFMMLNPVPIREKHMQIDTRINIHQIKQKKKIQYMRVYVHMYTNENFKKQVYNIGLDGAHKMKSKQKK